MPRAIAVAALVGLCWTSSARAEPCPEPTRPQPVESTPASGAGGVTLDAPVRVLYSPGYFGEAGWARGDETITLFDAADVPVPGVVRQVGDAALFFVPDDLLEPSTRYRAVATGVFSDLELSFTTGTALDEEAPVAPMIHEVRSTPVGASCGSPEGYRVSVAFRSATDDGALGSLEYQLFVTRGEGFEAPERVARQRNFATSGGIAMGFVLPKERAGGDVCVALRVEDGVGRSDVSPVVCFDPVTSVRFASLCGVSAVGAGGERTPWALALTALGLILFARRRHRAS